MNEVNEVRKVLVTGVAGGVGRSVLAALTKHGYSVAGLARPEDNLDGIHLPHESIVRGYVEDARTVSQAIHDCDAVVNCAALLPNSLHLVDSSAFHRVNVIGSQTVLERAIEHRLRKAIFCSTISVVDHNGSHVTQETLEHYVSEPHDVYLRSKIDAEKIVRKLAGHFDGEVHIIRPSFIYGPSNFASWRDGIDLIASNKMYLIGSGEVSLPLIYADDIAEFVVVALKSECPHSSVHTHILSNPEPTTMALIFDFIADYLQVKRPRRLSYGLVRMATEIVRLLPKRMLVGRLKLLTRARVRQYSQGYDMSGVDLSPLGFKPSTPYDVGMAKMLDDYFRCSKPPVKKEVMVAK